MMIGYTGTQKGMTEQQKNILRKMLGEIYGNDFYQFPMIFHHGDCIGGDEEACEIALEIGFELHCHPPINPNKRAFVESKYMEDERPYLDRNHDIVNACHTIFAAPFEKEEMLRSGTWATIRYAKKRNKRLFIIYPDGTTNLEMTYPIS